MGPFWLNAVWQVGIAPKCQFLRICFILVLFIGSSVYAGPDTQIVAEIPQPDGSRAVVSMAQADGVRAVSDLVEAVKATNVPSSSVGYIYPELRQSDTVQVETQSRVEEKVKVGRFRHALAISLTWGVSAFSVLVFSDAPEVARYANIGFAAVLAMSRFYKEDWQGDLVTRSDKYLTMKLSHSRFEKINKEFKFTTMASQFAMSLSVGFLSYNAQLLASKSQVGWEWAILSGALVATAAAGPWEEIFKRWIRGENSPVSLPWAYHLRDVRRLFAALAGPHVFASEGGVEKIVAQVYYLAVGVLGIRAFYLDPVRLQLYVQDKKAHMEQKMSSWRQAVKKKIDSCNILSD